MDDFVWPITTFVISMAFLMLFRKPVNELLARVRSVGKDGMQFQGMDEQSSVDRQADARPVSSKAHDLLQSLRSPVLRQREEAIKNDLRERKLDAESETTTVLVQYLADAHHQVWCESTYRLIFGSQISFLKQLNSVRAVTRAEAEEWYTKVVERFPELFTGRDPQIYYDFLVKQDLVFEADNCFYITDSGREFLIWMMRRGVTEQKPF